MKASQFVNFPPPRSRTRTASALGLAAALLIAVAGLDAQAGTFIDIRTGPEPADRIEGEATDAAHKGWIEVLSVDYSTDRGRHSSSRRRGAPTLGDVIVTKQIDKSSPKLQQAAVNGLVFPELLIEFPLADLEPGITFRLTNAIVTRFKTSVRAGGKVAARPIEQVSFYYERIEWVYRPDPTGAPPIGIARFDLLFGTQDKERDDDGDGIVNSLDPDDDNDGVDDEYEIDNGMHPLFADGEFDDDGDKYSNFSEWLAGTAAWDPNSKFSIHSISLDRDGRVRVKVPTIAGRHYRLRGSFDLAGKRWIDLDDFETDKGSPAAMMELELEPGAAAQFDRLFFCFEVSLPEKQP